MNDNKDNSNNNDTNNESDNNIYLYTRPGSHLR